MESLAFLRTDVALKYADFSSSGLSDDKRDMLDNVLHEALAQSDEMLKQLSQMPQPDSSLGAHRKGVMILLLDLYNQLQRQLTLFVCCGIGTQSCRGKNCAPSFPTRNIHKTTTDRSQKYYKGCRTRSWSNSKWRTRRSRIS